MTVVITALCPWLAEIEAVSSPPPPPPPLLLPVGVPESLHPAIRGLRTVCRCNNIKYKTIERAIREGAHTLSQVAARTGATTGQCGGSCTPEVQKLIEELAPKLG